MNRLTLCVLAFGVAGWLCFGSAFAQTPAPCDTVRAPGPRVIVELSKPQVVINEVDDTSCSQKEKCRLFKHERTPRAVREARPTVGLVMTPVFNTLGAAPPVIADGREPRHQALAGLSAAYEMDLQAATYSAARAAEEAHMKASVDALDRAARNLRAKLATAPAAVRQTAEPTDSNADVSAKIKALSERMDRIEELLLKHDDYLRKQIKPGS